MRRYVSVVFKRLWKAGRYWRRDDANLMAAAVAYYAALSFFPLLIVSISGIGLLLRFTNWGQDAQVHVLSAIGEQASSSVQEAVAKLLEQVQTQAAISGPLGLLALLFTATALFAHFERAFDRIWNDPPEPKQGVLAVVKHILWHRLRAFLMLGGLALVLLTNLILGVLWSAVESWSSNFLPFSESVDALVRTLLSMCINCLVITLLFWQLPKTQVRWHEALRGAIVATLGWELGRVGLALVFASDKFSAYGIVGSFLAVMLWLFYGICVIFLGAEYVQVICDECSPQQPEANRDGGDH